MGIKSAISEMLRIFKSMLSKNECDRIYWFGNLHYCESNISFVKKNKGDLMKILNLEDAKLTNESDFIDLYLCKKNDDWKLIMIYSPVELYANDKLIDTLDINITEEDLGKFPNLVLAYKND